jgi:hypothetical protein
MPTRPEPVPVLIRLLQAAGYHVERRPPGIRASRHSDHRILLLVSGTPSPADVEKEFPVDGIHRILVYAEEPGGTAREQAAARGIEVLGPTSLGPALGEILLPPSGPMPDAGPGGKEDEGPLTPPALVLPEGERTLRPRIAREDAEQIAGVEGFRVTLRLIPYYLFPYRVRTVSPSGGPRPVIEEVAAIQAISGRGEVWNSTERDLVSDVTEPHQRLEPLIPDSKAVELARETIRQRHTVRVDHTEQHGGAIVIERRRVTPGIQDLALGPPVLIHMPYWYVEGAEGRVVIDAVSGTKSAPGTDDSSIPL